MTALNKQELREAAEKALNARARLELIESIFDDDGDITSEAQGDIKICTSFNDITNPATVLELLGELEAKDATIATQQQEIRTLLNALEQATDKRNYDIAGQKRLIGWRASDYSDETSDPELAKNWAAAIGVLPIFEGDVNTKLTAAGIGVKGE
ncbi:ead/Ea22-like family protein [Citrobacter portucalensis]|uniref:ead/Ea22-like family protein n=1 Tax=Citrobacter freundii complex TaxID=1344959 RepID=UPI00190845D1|nr:ead/Ea22-like family protein [Citrobacter freundii]MBJ9632070.1 ead/Ea22-like family protein [Citrobacter freundii]